MWLDVMVGCGMWLDVMVVLWDVAGCNGGLVGCGWM